MLRTIRRKSLHLRRRPHTPSPGSWIGNRAARPRSSGSARAAAAWLWRTASRPGWRTRTGCGRRRASGPPRESPPRARTAEPGAHVWTSCARPVSSTLWPADRSQTTARRALPPSAPPSAIRTCMVAHKKNREPFPAPWGTNARQLRHRGNVTHQAYAPLVSQSTRLGERRPLLGSDPLGTRPLTTVPRFSKNQSAVGRAASAVR